MESHEIVNAKTPPNNAEAEACTIGSVLLWTGEGGLEVLDRIRTIVRSEDFYDPDHQIVFEALCKMADRGIEPDAVLLKSYLQRKDLQRDGMVETLVGCMEAVPSSAHAESYAKVVRDTADRRRAISKLHELFQVPYQTGWQAEDATAKLVDGVLELEAEAFDDDEPEPFDQLVAKGLDSYNEPTNRLPWGLAGMDAIMVGTPPGSVNVLGARPGGGKTTYALELVRAAARAGVPVALASLEMGREELLPIMLCGEARMDSDKWTRRRLESFDLPPLQEAAARLSKMEVGLFDPDGMTLRQFRAWAHRKASQGAKLIVLDYLQLLEGDPRKPRYEQFAEITREIKKTARRLAKRGYDCRLLILSQLNRDIEKAKRRKPQLSDLRESGTLEQDADSVFFLHPIEKDKGETGKVVDVEVIIAKHRSGRTGTALYRWDKAARYYTDLLGRTPPRDDSGGF